MLRTGDQLVGIVIVRDQVVLKRQCEYLDTTWSPIHTTWSRTRHRTSSMKKKKISARIIGTNWD